MSQNFTNCENRRYIKKITKSVVVVLCFIYESHMQKHKSRQLIFVFKLSGNENSKTLVNCVQKFHIERILSKFITSIAIVSVRISKSGVLQIKL